MIGYISPEWEFVVASEFFQLFKTIAEPCRPGKHYELILITTSDIPDDFDADVIVIYNSKRTTFDGKLAIDVQPEGAGVAELDIAGLGKVDLPIYGQTATLSGSPLSFLSRKAGSGTIASEIVDNSRHVFRIGYDLFAEVAVLLSQGQPSENAPIPTLELHIEILRQILIIAQVAFAEILPTPGGFDFMACLTHDVDFTGVREHRFDSTLLGFLYRATIGSAIEVFKGRIAWSRCWKNWLAVFSLPLVHLGLKEDFWLEFDRFTEIEKGLGSTFFFIPFRNRAGMLRDQPAPRIRAAKYAFCEMHQEITDLVNQGCEIGLHGIDAWLSSEAAAREREAIRALTGQSEVGVRMHWLYFDQRSPRALERANLSYDSTFGYNDAIGFRAGTAQAFRIMPSESLLELPLTIQDTAMFYPSRMGLSESSAMDRCKHLFRQTTKFGGVIVLNWHTRSLSPERLWGEFYMRLLEEMQHFRVCFERAGEVINWFRARREIRIEEYSSPSPGVRVRMCTPIPHQRHSFVIRLYSPNVKRKSHRNGGSSTVRDIIWKGEEDLFSFHADPAESEMCYGL